MNAKEPLRTFAILFGFDVNDPTLLNATEALRKLKKGELDSLEADATLEPLIEAWTTNLRQRGPFAVAMGAESNSFFAAPLREWAANAGVDENDAILSRALKAQAKGRSTDWISNLEMDIAAMAFIEGHFEVKDAWPPKSGQIERLLQSFRRRGIVSPSNPDEFRLLAEEVLSDWQPEYSPAFKKRIELALRWLEDPARGEFPEP